MLGYTPGADTPTPGADTPTPGADTPQADTPLEQTPPEADPLRSSPTSQQQTPPGTDGYCCGWYTSYWNAFLLPPADEVAER